MNPRQRLDMYIKNLAIGTEWTGLVEDIDSKTEAIVQRERMQGLGSEALKHIYWGCGRLQWLALGMQGKFLFDGG